MMIRRTLVCLLMLAPAATSGEVPNSGVDFSRDILPLLSDNCFKCHGPDKANRQTELRLDKHESAVAALASGLTAIVPGNSGDSELFVRVSSSDADLKMPPPDSGK